MSVFVRNGIGLLAASAVYLLLLSALHFLELTGRDALVLLFVFHVGFGILSYFLFTGRVGARAFFVFLVVLAYGVMNEIVDPDPGHEFVQVFVAGAFGVLAGGATLGGVLLESIWIRVRARLRS